MWTRRSVLLGAGGLLALPRLAGASCDRNLIVLLASGGWDVTYALDPKLGVPGVDGPELDEDPDDPDDREAVRTFAGIPVVVNDWKRPEVSAYFAAHGHRTSVVNGLFMAAISHESALVRVLTGTGDLSAPDVGAIVGGRCADLPLGYVDLAGQGFFGPHTTTSGRLGQSNQLGMLLGARGLVAPDELGARYPTWAAGRADLEALDRFVVERAASAPAAAAPVMAQLVESRLRARMLRETLAPHARELAVGGAANLLSDGRLAADLLAAGVCRAVLLDSRAHWDTHADNAAQHASFDKLFRGLRLLVDGLMARGLLENTVVVVLSEMTRTPLRNVHGGKDHWPYGSALVVGGGIEGGRVLGGTSDLLESLPVDLATGAIDPSGVVPRYDHLVAGVLELVGVDPAEHVGAEPLRGF